MGTILGSYEKIKAFKELPLAGAYKRGDQSIEKYSDQYTDTNGFVKSRNGYRKKVASAEPLKGTAPMTDQEYKNTTGRTRSTLLGG